MSDLRLLIFDVDGTLVDSQADIKRAMQIAFASVGLDAPAPEATLSLVGISLDLSIPQLAPQLSSDQHKHMVETYKDAFATHRGMGNSSPLYPGIRAMLDRLSKCDELLIGVATGKSRRGLSAVLSAHGLENLFVTEQVSDFHPSKPHPAMLQAALAETGVDADAAIMVGDTTFDLDMAKSAGVYSVGVTWGYHDAARLTSAGHVIDDIADLPDVLKQRWGIQL